MFLRSCWTKALPPLHAEDGIHVRLDLSENLLPDSLGACNYYNCNLKPLVISAVFQTPSGQLHVLTAHILLRDLGVPGDQLDAGGGIGDLLEGPA